MIGMQLKRCSKCGEEKPLSDYYKNVKQSSGYATYCKECAKEVCKRYIEANPEKKKEYSKKYRDANTDKMKESTRKWRRANPEKEKESRKRWKEANPEKVKEHSRKWLEANREKAKEYIRRRVANCSPCYIKSKLKRQGFIDNQITPELIEIKRTIIKIKRKLK